MTEEAKLRELENALLAGDNVSSAILSELSQKLQSETAVPEGYNILLGDSRLSYLLANN